MRVTAPFDPLPEPMLAKAVPTSPTRQRRGRAALRAEVGRLPRHRHLRRRRVEIGSRGSKTLTRYFPELVEAFRAQLPGRAFSTARSSCAPAPGTSGSTGRRCRSASTRRQPASRSSRRDAGRVRRVRPARRRDARLPRRARSPTTRRARRRWRRLRAPLLLTADARRMRRWPVAGSSSSRVPDSTASSRSRSTPAYAPGKRIMLKIKHHRTADVVAARLPRPQERARASVRCCSGCTTTRASCSNVGGVSRLQRRAPRCDSSTSSSRSSRATRTGTRSTGETERSRFSSAKDMSFVKLRPERVLEVRYDQMEGERFRHTVQFERWRPDREPRSCTFDQLEARRTTCATC